MWSSLVPRPQEWIARREACVLGEGSILITKEEVGAEDEASVELVARALEERWGRAPLRAAGSEPGGSGTVVMVGEPAAGPVGLVARLAEAGIDWSDVDPGDGGYVLCIGRGGIVVAGQDARGTYHGAATLEQILRASPPGEPDSLPGLCLADWPDMAYRSVYGLELGNMEPGLLEGANDIMERLSRLKFNMLSLNNHNYAMLEREARGQPGRKVHQALTPVWARARRLHLTPRVEGEARYFPRGEYGASGRPAPEASSPDTLEGIRYTQVAKLAGLEPVRLAIRGRRGRWHPVANVIHDSRTGRSWDAEPVEVTDESGLVRYQENRDYAVRFGALRVPFFTVCHEGDGQPPMSPRWAESDNPPTTVARTTGSRIPDGTNVRISFTYLGPDPWDPNKYRECLSDRRLFSEESPENYFRRFCTEPVRFFSPRQYFLSVDEYRVLAWDKRCLDSGRSRSEIYADFIRDLYTTIRGEDPRIEIFMWSDMVDPAHNATVYGSGDAADRILDHGMNDLIMVPWEASVADRSISFLKSKGFAVMASCQNEDPDQGAARWSYHLRSAFGDGSKRYGLQYTTWEGNAGFGEGRWPAIEAVAQAAWSRGPFVLLEEPDVPSAGEPIRLRVRVEPSPWVYREVVRGGRRRGDVGPGRRGEVTVRLLYRRGGADGWGEVTSTFREGQVQELAIPPQDDPGARVEYYLEARDAEATSRLPRDAPRRVLRVPCGGQGKAQGGIWSR